MSADNTTAQTADPRVRQPDSATGSTRSEADIIKAIKEATGNETFFLKAPRRIEGFVVSENVHDMASLIWSRVGFQHLSAISCVDWLADGEFELVYHFWSYRDSLLVSVKTRILREPASMATVSDIWQPASFFERDIHEMYGVVFEGNPDMEKYILTDWDGPPPMRKDFVTREFAHEHFHFRDYEPDWDELVKGGYHSNRGEGGTDV
ncbi:MAG: NADH-quinone oxidoreductase subunit C [Spirochaetaceae bacterium]|nr:NADH-quinone oxidoreductase subunit C [Spirochaetaceae bacterium]